MVDGYLADSVQGLEILLRDSFGLNETHTGAAAGFADRCGIVSVVLGLTRFC